jgi:hypothetical protein
MMSSNTREARRLWKLMSSDASEARRLWPDRCKRSKDHISNHNYTCRDEQALLVLIHMSLQGTAWVVLHCSPFRRLSALTGLLKHNECPVAFQV